MAFLFFIDESGQDHHDSPYEVLCAVGVRDQDLWDLIQALERCELDHFGRRYAGSGRELKARKLLSAKTFRLAAQLPPIDPAERVGLAKEALDDGPTASRRALTALGQTKIAFAEQVLEICNLAGVACFASVVDPKAKRSPTNALRKDYSYLFQRIFYFMEQQPGHERALLVMDELEQAEASILIEQMHLYFFTTGFGKARSKRIIAEPFFVHSEFTTGVQVADLAAYVISWNVRLKGWDAPARDELAALGEKVKVHDKRYTVEGLAYAVRAFVLLSDLRTKSERDLDSQQGVGVEQLVAKPLVTPT